MVFFKESEIDYYIEEDIPYYDLTTESLDISNKKAKITFSTRDETVIACSEEVKRVLEKLGAYDIKIIPSGTKLQKGEEFISAYGTARSIHQAWKASQNILEYACAVATYTYKMLQKARKYNKDIEILTTRKTQPGVKKIAIKSVLSGGGSIHRLGASESFLLFGNHKNFIEKKELIEKIKQIDKKLIEKNLLIESDSMEEVLEFAKAGIRLFQLEKMEINELKSSVSKLKSLYNDIHLLATGGINMQNVEEHASTGVDGLVTTAPYFSKPANIKVRITPA